MPGFLFWVALLYTGRRHGDHSCDRPSADQVVFRAAALRGRFPFRSRKIARIQRADRAAARRGDRALGAMSNHCANIYDNYMRIVACAQDLCAFHRRPTIWRASHSFHRRGPFLFHRQDPARRPDPGRARLWQRQRRRSPSLSASTSGSPISRRSLDRLTSFDAAIDRALALKAKKPRIEIVRSALKRSANRRTRPRTAGRTAHSRASRTCRSRRVSRHCWSVRPERASRPCFAPSPASGRSASAGSPSREAEPDAVAATALYSAGRAAQRHRLSRRAFPL